MATTVLKFDHTDSPVLSRGAKLGAAGVSHPSLLNIGLMDNLYATDGNFSAVFLDSQIDYDNDGYLYVADYTNGRIQRFVKNASGAWVYDSKVSTITALGSPGAVAIVAIDRTRDQIHIAAEGQNVDNTWIGVWDLATWPNLTVANRVRSYGSNSASNVLNKAQVGKNLTLVGDLAFVMSSSGNLRGLVWNHVTGAVVGQRTSTGTQTRFVGDSGLARYYGSGIQTTGTTPGLHRVDPTTLNSISRVDTNVADVQSRRGRVSNFASSLKLNDLGVHGGRVYVREYARLSAYVMATDTYLDDFMHEGPAGTAAFQGFLGHARFESAGYGRFGFWVSPSEDYSDEIILWQNNADNSASQSWLGCLPISVSSAYWNYADFSINGTSSLKRIIAIGENLSAEKARLSWRKNGGAWNTVGLVEATDPDTFTAYGAAATFTSEDEVDFRIEMSTWDRLDGHATRYAVADKASPEDVFLLVELEDPDYVTVPSITADIQVTVAAPEVQLTIDL